MEVAHGIDATLKSKEVSLFHDAFVCQRIIFINQCGGMPPGVAIHAHNMIAAAHRR